MAVKVREKKKGSGVRIIIIFIIVSMYGIMGCYPQTRSALKSSSVADTFNVDMSYQEAASLIAQAVEAAAPQGAFHSQGINTVIFSDLKQAEITGTHNPTIGSSSVLLYIKINGNETGDKSEVTVWAASYWKDRAKKIKQLALRGAVKGGL